MKKTLILPIAFVFISLNAFSQQNFQIHIGAGLPLSDFSNDDFSDSEYAGGATTGINLGFNYTYPISNGLGLFTGVDININGLNDDSQEDLENLVTANGIIEADVKQSRYINVPLSAGLKYELDLSGSMSLYMNGGVTINFFKTTDFKVTYPNNEVVVSYDIDNSVGFKIGAGINVTENVSLGLDYFALGKFNTDGELEIPGIGSINQDIKTKVDLLTISLGYRF